MPDKDIIAILGFMANFIVLLYNGFKDRKNAKESQEKIEGVHVLVNSEAEKQRKVVAALQSTIAMLLQDKANRSGSTEDAVRASVAMEQIAEAQILPTTAPILIKAEVETKK